MTDLNLLLKALEYDFIQKALICGILIGIASSLLGNFLVLRQQSLISDGLSHVSFASIAIALFFGFSPLIFSIPVVILSSILINKLTENSNFYHDTAIGLVSSLCIAIGIITISLSKGFNIDIYSYLFGSILTISNIEIIITFITSLIAIILLLVFFNVLFLLTYDEDYAKISSINIKFINTILAIIQSIVIVIGIKILGTMLITSLIIFPSTSALQVARNFKEMIIFSIIISIFSIITGIFLSFILNLPTSATIVIINGIIFFIMYLLKKLT